MCPFKIKHKIITCQLKLQFRSFKESSAIKKYKISPKKILVYSLPYVMHRCHFMQIACIMEDIQLCIVTCVYVARKCVYQNFCEIPRIHTTKSWKRIFDIYRIFFFVTFYVFLIKLFSNMAKYQYTFSDKSFY